jgi:small-conductance mechanosensitive channel
MQSFPVLEHEYYHNTVSAWVTALAIAAVVFFGLVVVRQLARRFLDRAAAAGHIHPLAEDLAKRTRFLFLLALALAVASLGLTLPAAWKAGISDFLFVAFCLQVALWGDGLINYALHGYFSRQRGPMPSGVSGSATTTAAGALGTVARGGLWLVVVVVALDGVGIRVNTLVAGLGITGIAIALALQSVLGDVFAALSIVVDKPFVVGDSINVDSISGKVEQVGLKTTRVRADTGEIVVLGNSDLLKSRIRNFGQLRQRTLIFTVVLDQATTADALARVPDLIREVVSAQPDTQFGRSHVTLPRDRGIAVETAYTVTSADYTRFLEVQQATTLGLLRGLEQAHVELAQPPGATVVLQSAALSDASRTNAASPRGPTTKAP